MSTQLSLQLFCNQAMSIHIWSVPILPECPPGDANRVGPHSAPSMTIQPHRTIATEHFQEKTNQVHPDIWKPLKPRKRKIKVSKLQLHKRTGLHNTFKLLEKLKCGRFGERHFQDRSAHIKLCGQQHHMNNMGTDAKSRSSGVQLKTATPPAETFAVPQLLPQSRYSLKSAKVVPSALRESIVKEVKPVDSTARKRKQQKCPARLKEHSSDVSSSSTLVPATDFETVSAAVKARIEQPASVIDSNVRKKRSIEKTSSVGATVRVGQWSDACASFASRLEQLELLSRQIDEWRQNLDGSSSDIEIVCSDGTIRRAHSFILQVRCPALLHKCTASEHQGRIQRSVRLDVSPAAVDEFLRYLYSGSASCSGVDKTIQNALASLASMFHLTLLSKLCPNANVAEPVEGGDHRQESTPQASSADADSPDAAVCDAFDALNTVPTAAEALATVPGSPAAANSDNSCAASTVLDASAAVRVLLADSAAGFSGDDHIQHQFAASPAQRTLSPDLFGESFQAMDAGCDEHPKSFVDVTVAAEQSDQGSHASSGLNPSKQVVPASMASPPSDDDIALIYDSNEANGPATEAIRAGAETRLSPLHDVWSDWDDGTSLVHAAAVPACSEDALLPAEPGSPEVKDTEGHIGTVNDGTCSTATVVPNVWDDWEAMDHHVQPPAAVTPQPVSKEQPKAGSAAARRPVKRHSSQTSHAPPFKSPERKRTSSSSPPKKRPPKALAAVQVLKTDNVTPYPGYEGFNTPQLKMQLSKHGVRPLGRKRAVALLRHIYESTHPPVDSLAGSSPTRTSPKTSSRPTALFPANAKGSRKRRASDGEVDADVSVDSEDGPPPAEETALLLDEDIETSTQSQQADKKPISFEQIYRRFNESCARDGTNTGKRSAIGKTTLIDFLDEEAITFFMESEDAGWKGRRKNKLRRYNSTQQTQQARQG